LRWRRPGASLAEESHPQLKEISFDYGRMDRESVDTFDLVIAGAGPAGLTVGGRVAKAGFKVCVIDPSPLAVWPNNFGVWVDEFKAMGLDDCFSIVWPKADVFLSDKEPSKFSGLSLSVD